MSILDIYPIAMLWLWRSLSKQESLETTPITEGDLDSIFPIDLLSSSIALPLPLVFLSLQIQLLITTKGVRLSHGTGGQDSANRLKKIWRGFKCLKFKIYRKKQKPKICNVWLLIPLYKILRKILKNWINQHRHINNFHFTS